MISPEFELPPISAIYFDACLSSCSKQRLKRASSPSSPLAQLSVDSLRIDDGVLPALPSPQRSACAPPLRRLMRSWLSIIRVTSRATMPQASQLRILMTRPLVIDAASIAGLFHAREVAAAGAYLFSR